MNMLVVTSPMPPSVNLYLGKRVVGSGKRAYVQVYETAKAKAYKKEFKKILQEESYKQKWVVPAENKYIIAEMTFYMASKSQDTHNFDKCLIDCFQEQGLIINDSKVLVVPKEVYIDSKNPRIEVVMYESEKVGVFKNDLCYRSFIATNCNKCTRYDRNCSILNKALDNKIQDEVDHISLQCSKNNNKRKDTF